MNHPAGFRYSIISIEPTSEVKADSLLSTHLQNLPDIENPGVLTIRSDDLDAIIRQIGPRDLLFIDTRWEQISHFLQRFGHKNSDITNTVVFLFFKEGHCFDFAPVTPNRSTFLTMPVSSDTLLDFLMRHLNNQEQNPLYKSQAQARPPRSTGDHGYAEIAVDSDGKIISANERASVLSGYSFADLAGMHSATLFGDGSGNTDFQSGSHLNSLLFSANGRVTPIELIIFPDLFISGNHHGKRVRFDIPFKSTESSSSSDRSGITLSILGEFITDAGPNLEKVMRTFVQQFQVSRSYLIMFHDELTPEVKVEWRVPEAPGKQSVIANNRGPSSDVIFKSLATMDCIILENLPGVSDFFSRERDALIEQGVKSGVIFPIKTASRNLIGYLGIEDLSESHIWSIEDLKLIKIITEILGHYYDRKIAFEEKVSLEAQLRQSQKLESLGTMASGIAHEINNPLMGMINYAEIIQDSIEADNPNRQFTEGIISEGERISKIVKDLLSFSRTGESREKIQMAMLIERTLNLIRASLIRSRIHLEIDIAENLPNLYCSENQIIQVILNLLTNARDSLNQKFPESSSDKRILIHSKLFFSNGKKMIRTIVEDHGQGIPELQLGKIFDPFFTIKPRNLGTGLGLYVSYRIIKDHHGNLVVESEAGKYARFFLDLPESP